MRFFPGALFVFIWLLAGCSLLVGNYSAKDDLEDASALEDGSALEVNPDDAGIADDSGVMDEDTCAGTISITQIAPDPTNPIADTVDTTVKISTGKPAQCKYAWKAGISFNDIQNSFPLDDQSPIIHTTTIQTIKGQNYKLYLTCQADCPPEIQNDFLVHFSVSEYPKNIYRSIGQANPLAGGKGLTIDGDKWVTFKGPFSSLDWSNQIGVGDILRFDSNNSGGLDSGDACLMIAGRLGEKVRFAGRDIYNQDWTPPTQDLSGSSWEICRAFSNFHNALYGSSGSDPNTCFESCSLNSDWEGLTRNLPSQGEGRIWNFAGYNDNNSVIVDYATSDFVAITDEGHYIKIYAPYLKNEVAESQRHSGIFGNGGTTVIKETDNAAIITFFDNQHVWIDGLQVDVTINEGLGVARGNSFLSVRHRTGVPGWMKLSNNLVKGYRRPFHISCDETSDNLCYRAYCERCDTGSCQQGNCAGHCAIGNHALYMLNATSTNVYLWNNVFFGFRQLCAGSEATAILLGPTETFNNLYLYNNTFIDNEYAIKAYDSNHSLLLINNLFSCSGNGCVSEFMGSLQMHPKSTYNATSLSYDHSSFKAYSMPGVTFYSCPFKFQGLPGANNFHLQSSDTGARNLGTCPQSDPWVPQWPNDDFEGDLRPACPPNNPSDPTSYWDIGADEYVPPTPTHRQSDQK